jgi:NADH:ubiquinone oxidoreductase subunit 6 (subunit J)
MVRTIVYSGIIFLVYLSLKLLREILLKRKNESINSLKQLINFGVILYYCWCAFMYLAIFVNVPSEITTSQEESLENLSKWILNEELTLGLIGLLIITIIGLLNFYFQRKFQGQQSYKPVLTLSLINLSILLLSLIVIYHYNYNGLSIEVGYHF